MVGLEVKLQEIPRAEEKLAKIPNVCYLAGCTGVFDIIALLVFRNSSEFDDFARNTVSSLPGFVRMQTFVNMHLAKSPWRDPLDLVGLLNSKNPKLQ